MSARHLVVLALSLSLLLAASAPCSAAGEHRLGVGANYWTTVDKIDVGNVDENGLSWLASYQYVPAGIFKFELDLEYFPSHLAGGPRGAWAPEAFAFVGGLVYAGAGVGIYNSDGKFGDSPFYMLRAGVDFPILPFLFLDVNANYRFNDWDSLKGSDLKADTIRLGAFLRLAM